MNKKSIKKISEIEEKSPIHALVSGIDLVVVKFDGTYSILYGRCLHRGALMADGHVDGENLICGVHGWDYRVDTGVSEYNNKEVLHKFTALVDGDDLCVDLDEIDAFKLTNPPAFNREDYQGAYADTHPEETEPYTGYIKELADNGLKNVGKHGFSSSMGVDRNTLPKWEDIQFLPAQMANKPLLDEDSVSTKVIIGPKAKKPLLLSIPLFVSDMSYGALSREAKIALSKGAELAGTGICSGEGGMLPDEKVENSKYFYELASAKFGFSWDKLEHIQAFHFKGGQGAKTGTGGHLPGNKVQGEIAKVRGLKEGVSAISPATFTDEDLQTAADFRRFGDKVRDISGGVPIGFKLAASHLEKDLAFALEAGADYIILDGRGGGTGSAPDILKNNINVPTIPALARARRFMDDQGVKDVSLIITGGLRIADDFAKALMLGADAVAVSNSALQAIGCLGMRACGTNNCPVGIATQKENLRQRIEINIAAQRLERFFNSSNDLIKIIARACGYNDISQFNKNDLSTLSRDMHYLTGINYAGFIK
ncbi:MAG: glutamate synthase domain-containing protein 2/nitrite reductase [Flavobacteriales bacterium]|jgi:glutamate synthase domain-containing protein 2/nitrite reductase/ring-hydroxylating ferredoxin subunit